MKSFKKQLTSAGVEASTADAPLSASDKGKLLDYLRKQHGGADESAGKRITLTRKSTTELFWINEFRGGDIAIMAAPRAKDG